MTSRRELVTDDGLVVVGAPRVPVFGNLHHFFLRTSWTCALGGIVAAFLAINLVYGALFALVGGIANARLGSFFDAFVFSVQTMVTIGYGVCRRQRRSRTFSW